MSLGAIAGEGKPKNRAWLVGQAKQINKYNLKSKSEKKRELIIFRALRVANRINMPKIRACGLTLCLMALFLLSFAGQL
jgi:hypothetical protein